MQQRKKRRRLLIVWLVLIAIVALVVFFGLPALRTASGALGNPVRLPALPTQQIQPFGNSILYYDGLMLTCANKSGKMRWNFQIGDSAGFHTNGTYVVAWSASQLYILDNSGNPLYNDRMNGEVQFARVGTKYTAAFVGDSDNGTVLVLDRQGRNVDSMPVEDQTLLDIGFFAADQYEYMWMMGLDTYGTVPSVTMQTFTPGSLAVGTEELGEQLAYRVYYHNARLYVVDTWQIRKYDYRLKEDTTSEATLIYGWYLQDIKDVGRNLMELLVQTPNSDGNLRASDLRLISNTSDRVLHLPAECFGAALGTHSAYGFSTNYVYACRYGENSFSTYVLPYPMDTYLGMVDNNCAILASGADIYLIELP